MRYLVYEYKMLTQKSIKYFYDLYKLIKIKIYIVQNVNSRFTIQNEDLAFPIIKFLYTLCTQSLSLSHTHSHTHTHNTIIIL